MIRNNKLFSLSATALILCLFGSNASGEARFVLNQNSLEFSGAIQTSEERALMRFMEGNFDGAKTSANQILTSDGNNSLALAVRGRVFWAEGKDDNIVRTDLENAVRINPNNYLANAFLALFYDAPPTKNLARQSAEKVLTLLNSPKNGLEYYARSLAYSVLERREDAIADLDKSVQLSPNYTVVYFRRGYLYSENNLNTAAIADFSKAIQINPRYPSPYYQRAKVFINQKDYEAAIRDLTQSLSLKPGDPQSYFSRGFAKFYLQKFDEAIADYTKVIELDPNSPGAYANRGAIYADYKQQFELAINDYNKAVELDPKFTAAYLNRSIAYDSVGKTKLADLDRKKFTELGGVLERTNPNAGRAVFPQATFNPETAKTALAVGTSTIRGRACSIKDNLIFDAAGVTISLYPVTPYLEEWHRLREKEEDKKTAVYMANEAVKYRIDVVTDSEGKFQFPQMKPGRYFLQGIFSFNQAKTATVYVGRGNNGNGSVTDYYQRENYIVPRSDRLEKFVDVKTDGETVKITMSKGRAGLLKFGGACSTW